MRSAIRRPGCDSLDGRRFSPSAGDALRPFVGRARGALALAAMTLSLSACAELVSLRDSSAPAAAGLASSPAGLTRNVVRRASPAPVALAERAAPVPPEPVRVGPIDVGPVEVGPVEGGPVEEGPFETAPIELAQNDLAQTAMENGPVSLSEAADVYSAVAEMFERDDLSYSDAIAETPFDPLAVPEAAAAMKPLVLDAPAPGGRTASEAAAADDLPGPRVPAGIYGTVTDAEKLIVNGIQIETAGARPEGLEIGDVVAIEGTEVNGFVNAASIEEIHALIGPMSDDIPLGSAHELTVMGVPVTLSSGTRIVDRDTRNEIDSFSLSVGDRLAVSGLWQDGAVIANRIERLSDSGPDEIAGALRHVDSAAFIGPLAIDGAPAGAAAEQFARVSGRYDNGRFVARDVAVGVPKALSVPGARLSIEGFLRSTGSSGMLGYRIDGLAMPLDPQATPSVQVAGGRAILIGESGDAAGAVFKAKQGVPLPNAFEHRLEILSTINDGFEPHNASPLR